MLLITALKMLVHEKEKYGGAIGGVALALFLMMLQSGFYLGFKRDIRVVIDAFDAQVWIMTHHRASFDNWDTFDDLPYWRVLGHGDVEAATRVIWAYGLWRIPPAGGKQMVQVLGVEFDAGVAVDVAGEGYTPLPDLLRRGHVFVNRKDMANLGVRELGQTGIEINGRRAVPVGHTRDIKLFTTSPFILTSLDNARAFTGSPPDHVSYIVCRLRPGADVAATVRQLKAMLPDHTVMSAEAFAQRTDRYWATRAGIGPILYVSSILSVAVGLLIVSVTFYISTLENMPIFATMKAIGAGTGEIVLILVLQVATVFVVGLGLAAGALWFATELFSRTTISVVLTPGLLLLGPLAIAACSLVACLFSLLKMISAEPGDAFRT